MIAKKISFASRYAMPIRSFGGRIPSIKFLGPRNLTNKSIGAYCVEEEAAVVAEPVAAQQNMKAVSPKAECTFADLPADRWARIEFSDLEMEIIN